MKKNLFFIFLCISFMAYLFLRAIKIPITTDEGATLINHVRRTWWDIFTYEKDAVPNNHILNTAFIKLLQPIFGLNHVEARISALLGGFLYFLSSVGIARILTKNFVLQLFCVILLLGNHYMIEFFSLSRGYGLALGLIMSAIYFGLKWVESNKNQHLWASSMLGILSVEANFTSINFYLPFFVIFLWLVFEKNKISKSFLKNSIPLLFPCLVLAFVAYLPLTRMRASDQFRFWGNNGFISETLNPLMINFCCGNSFLELINVKIINFIVIFLSAVAIFWSIWLWKRNNLQMYKSASVVLVALFSGTVLFNLMQFWILKTPYLSARTALFFYPLFTLTFVVLILFFLEKSNKTVQNLFVFIIITFIAINFIKRINIKESREWWFDRETFKVLEYLKELHREEKREKPLTFNTTIGFHNSFSFHIEHNDWNHLDYVENVPWHEGTPTDAQHEFYYSNKEELPILLKKYNIVWEVSPKEWYLLRRK
jgi:hypothetical protein